MENLSISKAEKAEEEKPAENEKPVANPKAEKSVPVAKEEPQDQEEEEVLESKAEKKVENKSNSKNNKNASKSKQQPKKNASKGAAPKTDSKQAEYIFATGVLESRVKERDVKIGAFALSAYGKELIKDTSIELTIGRRYGLIGSNGSGKSSFLRALADRLVPIPDHMDLYYLAEECAPSEQTAIEAVVACAKEEIKRLEAEAERVLDEEGADSEQLLAIHEKLDEMDPDTFEARAGKLLFGLGFDAIMITKKTKDMSGGWRMRVSLAKALFIRPTLLLLDEPTNHLDLEACVWLEQYLSTYPYCLVVISHSQDFLNGVCTNIIYITPKKTLQYWSGNYDIFVQTKAEVEANQMKAYQKEQDDIKHIKQFVASCGTFSNLVKQAKSKQKIIDKMEARGLTEKVVAPPKFNFKFAECERLAPPVLALVDVGFAYSGQEKDMLYQNLNLGVDMDSRIALVGPNGAGKSTLLKLMTADVSPTKGVVRRHIHLKLGRYHQHSTDQLDPNMPVLDFIMNYFKDQKKDVEDWRRLIGRYGITGKDQLTKIGQLSDGMKTRIVFSMLAGDRPNVLLLDEPTNHLDMECIDSLAEAIKAFEGGVVLVSHDFRLLSQVAKDIWLCDKGTVKPWPGSIRSYKDSLIKKMKF